MAQSPTMGRHHGAELPEANVVCKRALEGHRGSSAGAPRSRLALVELSLANSPLIYCDSKTETLLDSRLVVTTSGLPSPFTSPTASCQVPLPVAMGDPDAGRKPPLPSPSMTRTPRSAAATTSALPS